MQLRDRSRSDARVRRGYDVLGRAELWFEVVRWNVRQCDARRCDLNESEDT